MPFSYAIKNKIDIFVFTIPIDLFSVFILQDPFARLPKEVGYVLCRDVCGVLSLVITT